MSVCVCLSVCVCVCLCFVSCVAGQPQQHIAAAVAGREGRRTHPEAVAHGHQHGEVGGGQGVAILLTHRSRGEAGEEAGSTRVVDTAVLGWRREAGSKGGGEEEHRRERKGEERRCC